MKSSLVRMMMLRATIEDIKRRSDNISYLTALHYGSKVVPLTVKKVKR